MLTTTPQSWRHLSNLFGASKNKQGTTSMCTQVSAGYYSVFLHPDLLVLSWDDVLHPTTYLLLLAGVVKSTSSPPEGTVSSIPRLLIGSHTHFPLPVCWLYTVKHGVRYVHCEVFPTLNCVSWLPHRVWLSPRLFFARSLDLPFDLGILGLPLRFYLLFRSSISWHVKKKWART